MYFMAIRESGEDYLETILILQMKTGHVRSIDVAAELGFSKPSISRAMSILKDNGFITIEKDGKINLTNSGQQKAEQIYERHLLIRGFLENTLGVTKETAEQDACKIEHILSDETYQKLKCFLNDSNNKINR